MKSIFKSLAVICCWTRNGYIKIKTRINMTTWTGFQRKQEKLSMVCEK